MPSGADRNQEDQASSDNQSLAGADQTQADADQTSSDTDQTASEEDQAASDRDQAAADDEFDEDEPDDSSARRVYDESTEARAEGTRDRNQAQRSRHQTSSARDEAARHRDRTANQRDRLADQEDRESERLEEELAAANPEVIAALEAAGTLRARGASDRARAAEYRERAARDREEAARDRAELEAELQRSGIDEVTGAYRRGIGSHELANEIERAKRSGVELVLAFVDVDGLKRTNDQHGHDAGDELLHRVADSLRSKLRSYDPIARWGGDEFVCAISAIGLEGARRRLEEAGEALDEAQPGASISVGFASLQKDDTLESLVERADHALLAGRRNRG
jgi:diguanylate cyclase (GGDEF)-like protein